MKRDVVGLLIRFVRAKASAALARAGGARKPRQKPYGRQLSESRAPRIQGRLLTHRKDAVGAKPFSTALSLSQLRAASNPELMREVFQRHLRPMDGKIYQIRECRIDHIRYRRARRCILQYTLHLAEPSTGRERSQWVTGAMYAGRRTRQIWGELRKSDPGLGISDAFLGFAPFSYIPGLDMLAQVFPYDHQLPALPLLMAELPPELEARLLAQFGEGDWQAEAWDIEPVRYLSGVRASLRLTGQARDAATGRAQEKCFYAKVYGRETGKQTYQTLRALWDRANSGGVGFTVGKPIAYISALKTLLQEEASGTPLSDILLYQKDKAAAAVRKVAKALAALHLDHVATPRCHRLRDEISALRRQGEFLQWTCPHLQSDIEKVIGAVVAGLEEVVPTPTHRDLKPEHILLDGDRITLLDLDMFAAADPVLDVACLLGFLRNMPSQFQFPYERSAQAVEQAFAQEYFDHVPEAWYARLPFHYAGAVLRQATDLSRQQAPGWSDGVETLVEDARNSLAGRVW